MEPLDKEIWLKSVMNTKRLTHLHRVIAWHLLQMTNEEGFIPHSMMEMGRRIGFTVDRSHISKCMYSLKRIGYILDLGPKLAGTKDRTKRFKLTMPKEDKINGAEIRSYVDQIQAKAGGRYLR